MWVVLCCHGRQSLGARLGMCTTLPPTLSGVQDGEGAYDQKIGVDFFRAEIGAIMEFGNKAVSVLKLIGHLLAVSQIILYNGIIVSAAPCIHTS